MTPTLLGWTGGSLLIVAAATVLAVFLADPRSPLRRAFHGYERRLDAQVGYLFLRITGPRIARIQLAVVLGSIGMVAVTSNPLWAIPAVLAAGLPPVMLDRARSGRTEKLEKQLDTWLLAVANSLKASGSIGEAIESSSTLVPPPMSQEVDLILKETRLGTPLANALRSAARRIGSRTITSGLSTIVVGQKTGGDVPRILEETAATLREMARLESVFRRKTSEARTQTLVLAVMPFGLMAALYALDEHWFDPLSESFLGNLIAAAGALLWAASLLVARKILTFRS